MVSINSQNGCEKKLKTGKKSNMHELSLMLGVIKTVERIAKEQNVGKISTLVLQIGEISSVIPRYIEQCYPAAVEGTLLKGARLKIEIVPGNAECKGCSKIFNLMENMGKCPYCGSEENVIVSGKEFVIKEIAVSLNQQC